MLPCDPCTTSTRLRVSSGRREQSRVITRIGLPLSRIFSRTCWPILPVGVVMTIMVRRYAFSCGGAALRVDLGGPELHQAGSVFIRRVWFVVPDPPLVRRSLRVAVRRVFPLLLAPKRSDGVVVPIVSHLLV